MMQAPQNLAQQDSTPHREAPWHPHFTDTPAEATGALSEEGAAQSLGSQQTVLKTRHGLETP